jgi:hypothetical protein
MASDGVIVTVTVFPAWDRLDFGYTSDHPVWALRVREGNLKGGGFFCKLESLSLTYDT